MLPHSTDGKRGDVCAIQTNLQLVGSTEAADIAIFLLAKADADDVLARLDREIIGTATPPLEPKVKWSLVCSSWSRAPLTGYAHLPKAGVSYRQLADPLRATM